MVSPPWRAGPDTTIPASTPYGLGQKALPAPFWPSFSHSLPRSHVAPRPQLPTSTALVCFLYLPKITIKSSLCFTKIDFPPSLPIPPTSLPRFCNQHWPQPRIHLLIPQPALGESLTPPHRLRSLWQSCWGQWYPSELLGRQQSQSQLAGSRSPICFRRDQAAAGPWRRVWFWRLGSADSPSRPEGKWGTLASG